ncbi:unnamed protein product [Cunninghamella blakesleeana]
MPQPLKRKRNNLPLDFKEAKQKIRTLEAELSDKTHLNNIVDLITLTKPPQIPKTIHSAIHALHCVFTRLLENGDLQKHRQTHNNNINNNTSTKQKKPKTAMEKYQQEQLKQVEDKEPSNNNNEKDASNAIYSWLRERYMDFTSSLRDLLDNDEPGLQLPALNILMNLLKTESKVNKLYSKAPTTFANNFFGPVVSSLLFTPHFIGPLQKEFIEKYVNVYDDVRHYFYKDTAEVIEKTLKEQNDEQQQKQKKGTKRQKSEQEDNNNNTNKLKLYQLLVNSFTIAESISTMPTDASEIDDFWTLKPELKENDDDDDNKKPKENYIDAILGGSLSGDEDDGNKDDTKKSNNKKNGKKLPPLLQLSVHKKSFQNCWLAILKLPMTDEYYKRTLLVLHKRVLPYMSDARLLMDFLTDAYNVGGAISLLALNGVFTLINEYNLDYPEFYHKLYSLLDRDVLHMKYRSRFFRLLELFLSSAYLPAALIAAFIKKLAQLSLSAPPSACVIIVPFIYNLLKRHPTCMSMIHSQASNADQKSEDPFDADTTDPYKSNAIDSSLWELQTLSQHYYANVSTLAKIFSEQFLKPKYNLEDFLDHTYATFFKTEIERKRKKTPALAFEKPKEFVWEI